MTAVLLFATVLTPIILALVELVKKVPKIPVNLLPLIALLIGMIVGFVAYPFTDLQTDLRLWAGALSGLAATGLFELGTKREGVTKGVE